MAILIIDNYDSFTFNLVQQVQMLTSSDVKVFRNDEITLDEVKAIAPERIILSPGPGHPANPQDFGVCADIIKNAQELGCPILGVCLGHQGIVHYFGGEVVRAVNPVHGKQSKVRAHGGSTLFQGLAQDFEVMRYHSLAANPQTIPADLRVAATTTDDGTVMAIEHRSLPLFGLQFHPESIGTPLGAQIMENFLQV